VPITAQVQTSEHPGSLGRVGDGFVDQQNRDIVSDRVDAATLGALQAFPSFLEQQGLLANRAD